MRHRPQDKGTRYLARALRRAAQEGMDRDTFADRVLEVSRWTLWRVTAGKRALRHREIERLSRYLARAKP